MRTPTKPQTYTQTHTHTDTHTQTHTHTHVRSMHAPTYAHTHTHTHTHTHLLLSLGGELGLDVKQVSVHVQQLELQRGHLLVGGAAPRVVAVNQTGKLTLEGSSVPPVRACGRVRRNLLLNPPGY